MAKVFGILCSPRRAECCRGKQMIIEIDDGVYRKKCNGCGKHTEWFKSLEEAANTSKERMKADVSRT